MATMSGGQQLDHSVGFGQFRLTTFVDSNQLAKSAASATTTTSTAATAADSNASPSQTVVEKGLRASSLLLSAQAPQSTAFSLNTSHPSSTNAPQSSALAHVHSPPPHLPQATATASQGFGILDLASPVAREGKLGPHRDRRVRNPVPRKLKGKTDDKNGNFAVMHMDMSGSGGIDQIPRSEAAQRTSESTAQAARSAQQGGYVPVKRRRVEPMPDSVHTPVQAGPPTEVHAAQAFGLAAVELQQEVVRRTRSLTTEETKYEQARLLTLLRSINPITVVDQICKALAFFGGIPGAPPPDDGNYPDSAESNGSGSLFIGWVSEIFPELERTGWRPEALKTREGSRGKRPRGRPKGSKASKARKDKGIKKGPKHGARGLSAPALPRLTSSSNQALNNEDDWVDVGDSEINIESTIKPKSTPRDRVEGLTSLKNSIQQTTHGQTEENPVTFQSSMPSLNQQSPTTASTGKRRPGRPRGSRNRPKDGDSTVSLSPQSGFGTNAFQVTSHRVSPVPRPQAKHTYTHQQVSSDATVASDTQSNPVGTSSLNPTNGSNSGQSFTATSSYSAPQERATTSMPLTSISKLGSQKQDALESLRVSQTSHNPQLTKPPAAAKRKRARPQSSAGPNTDRNLENTASGSGTGISGPQMNKNIRALQSFNLPITSTDPASMQSSQPGTYSPGPNVPNVVLVPTTSTLSDNLSTQAPFVNITEKSSATILPPVKRQRKSKDPVAVPARKKTTQEVNKPAPTAAMVSTSASLPTSAPNRPATNSVTSSPSINISTPPVMPMRPPAQGLEAHYEHFAHLQQQQQQPQPQRQRQSQQFPQLEHRQSRLNQSNPAQSSPLQNSSAFYQQPRHMPSMYQGYPSQQAPRPYQNPQPQQNDSYRGINHQQQHSSFSPRQPTSQFPHFTDSSLFDLPALEAVGNNTANLGGYGHAQGLSRSASQGSFGTGGGLGNGFEAGLGDNDLRDRLLRGIGPR